MDFEAYLHSKKIDSAQFQKHEPALWESWQKEFVQINPTSFTAQKLYLINPIRRKYHYNVEPARPAIEPAKPVIPSTESPQPPPSSDTVKPETEPAKPAAKPAVPRPVFKPKPKLNS